MRRLVELMAALLAALGVMSAAHAQAPTRCDPTRQCCRQANLPGDPGCAGAGNPINILTGNKYQREEDLPALPGLFGIEIVRHYNSAAALDTHANRANGLLGKGWRLSYEIGVQHDGANRRVVTLADGSEIAFARGVLQPAHFLPADLSQGRLVEQGNELAWQRLDGTRLAFDAQGRLSQLHAPTGEFTSLAYDGTGRLVKVTDPQGRSLVLGYADAKSATRYRGVTHIDGPIGRFEYAYAQGAEAPANLVRVGRPGGAQRVYHYEDSRHASALTGISLKDSDATQPQRLSTYLYDAAGLAVLSTKGKPAALQRDPQGQPRQPHQLQEGSGIEQVIVERGPDGIVVFNALGQASHAQWVEIDGQRLLSQFTGPGCSTCPPANTRWVHDKFGRVKETIELDMNGRPVVGERHEFDAWGRLKAVLHVAYGKPARTQVMARFDYAVPFADTADATQPVLIARASVIAGREHLTRIELNAHGQPIRVTERGFSPIDERGEPHATAIERSTGYTYSRINGRSVLSAIDGPLANGPKADPSDSDITTLQWDERASAVMVVTQPAGFASRVQYDAAGRIERVSNDEGAHSRWQYDASGLPSAVERRSAGGFLQTQFFSHDAQGRLIETGSGVGADARPQVRQAYDAADRLLWQAHAIGWAQQWRYDAEGHVLAQSRISPAITQSVFYAWDRNGRLQAVSDNAGRRAEPDASRAAPAERPSARHRRDDFGRVVVSASLDSGLTLRAFDAADRMVSMRDALGQEARYEYDAAGRIVRQSAQARDAQAEVTTWRYEGRRLAEMVHPTQAERYGYDANGWMTSRAVTIGAHTAVTRYEFDAQGQLEASTLPDGSRLSYQRDRQGQVSAITRGHVRTAWLRGLETPQVLARDFERDMVGLKRYTAGNGIEARFVRSREGTLARVVYRHPQPQVQTARTGAPAFIGRNAQDFFERLLGVVPAMAQGPSPGASVASTAQGVDGALPGALGAPFDAQALIDHRYLWDARGNLLLDARRAGAQPGDSGYAYDRADRLVVAHVGPAATVDAAKPVADKSGLQSTEYYLHDALGRRVLSRQDRATRRIAFEEGGSRWTDDGQTRAEYDATGQPLLIGQRRFAWDMHGRLLRVSDGDVPIASYEYSHRGERVAKRTAQGRTVYLYDASSQLSAELDAEGRVRRQYVYAADLPIAVIDGDASLHAERSAWMQVVADMTHVVRGWVGRHDRVTWLHTNHLGAPEAGTDARGQLVWQATYAASGRVTSASSESSGIALNLRLPGQYSDAETGLHYNGHRYYDPERGQYLSPDPLAQAPGYRDGPNPYAYVRFNPLRYVDPLGLVLFAFDGTGNDLSDPGSVSNVARFARLYQGGGRARYVAGVGTRHNDPQWGNIEPPAGDAGSNGSGTRRIERMMTYLMEEARAVDDYTPMDIDIVGFSRGAAQARDFANNILGYFDTSANGDNFSFSTDARGWFNYSAVIRNDAGERVEFRGRQCVRFRFMGLWDTVLSSNTGRDYNMTIPTQFQHVAHAVALNEHRSQGAEWNATRRNLPSGPISAFFGVGAHWGAFPLESIGASSMTPGRVRIERGFVGAHADIGGGYAGGENQLSFVALSWMVAQARSAGVGMNVSGLDRIPTSNPIIHDQSNALRVGSPVDNQGNAQRLVVRDGRMLNTYTVEDRQVHGAVSGSQQRNMGFTNFGPNNRSMTFADTQPLISYLGRNLNGADNSAQTWIDRGPRQINGGTNQTGTVNIAEYMRWLRDNGYCFVGDACDRAPQ